VSATTASPELALVLDLLELRRNVRSGSLAERRAEYDRAALVFAQPDELVQPVTAGCCPSEWLGASSSDGSVLVYLHGGSFTLGSAASHRHLARALAAAAGARALVLDYPLAPESPFPAALDSALSAYEWLLACGYDHRRIVFAGDSAGAGLAVATALRLHGAGLPQPAAVACLSPWADLTFEGPSHLTHAARDPLLDTEDLRRMAVWYLAGSDPADPFASPALGDLGDLAPLLIEVGSEEILLSDARALAAAAAAAGTQVTLHEEEGMFHVWHWYYPFLPEAEAAIARVGRFLGDRIAATPA